MSKKKPVPLEFSRRKADYFDRKEAAEAVMDAGGPSPMEFIYQTIKKAEKHEEELREAYRRGFEDGKNEALKNKQEG